MDKTQRNRGNNVVQMPAKQTASQKTKRSLGAASGSGMFVAAGSPNDPRVREALRLAKAFLAIEDAQARGALVALAESLVSYDWSNSAQKR